MIETQATKVLHDSFQHLMKRNGQLNLGDVEAEVINQACKYIIKNENGLKTVHDVTQIGSVIGENMIHLPTATAFTSAASRLFPDHYGKSEIAAGNNGIIQNISWAGMWDFLSDYFLKNHGITIDNTEKEPIIFYSVHHDRYQDGQMVNSSPVERNINLVFLEERQEVIVSIEPTLSAKKARLISKKDDVYTYQGYDPDYIFHVHLNRFDEIDQFILELPNRNLKLIYR
jgi:hypothetical protein